MYRVYFTFRNELGEMKRDYLDNNGNGFNPTDALDVAREMKARNHRNVVIARIGTIADKNEMAEAERR